MNHGHEEMSCAGAREQFALLLYGELSFDEEERVESHLDGCVACREALEREMALHATFDQLQAEPAPLLLRECREDLFARLREEPAPRRSRAGWWERFTTMLAHRPVAALWQPVGALALLALGFWGARLTPFLGGGAYQAAGIVEPQSSRVRSVQPASEGRVQIVLDETRQRVLSGPIDDQQIRALLLNAAKDPSDPGLRAETVDILNTRAEAADVRAALIYTLGHDQNAGVRSKAMEGLKRFSQEPDVRRAFSQVLLSDGNPGLRTEAIDVLTEGATVDRQIIGTLQELMQRGEQEGYVRERSRRVLRAMNASAEIY